MAEVIKSLTQIGEQAQSKHCYKCGYDFNSFSVRACPHPAVNKVYGKAICAYCCRGCAFKTEEKHTSALGCSYVDVDKEDS